MSDESKSFLKNPMVMSSIAIILIVIAAFTIYSQVKPVHTPEGTLWYYDTDKNELFAAKDQIPPITSPGGNAGAGVRAYVYGCGGCADKSKLIVGWLEKFSDEDQKLLENPQGYTGLGDIGKGGRALVKKKDGAQWVNERSDEGVALAVIPKCDNGEQPKLCDGPDSK